MPFASMTPASTCGIRPEYLRLRFDEKTRGLNAISFAVMTLFSSGISMYAMGRLFQMFLGWDINYSIIIAALVVLAYTFLGGLTSSIYNEVVQFFLIVFGFLPLAVLGLMAVGGWTGLEARLADVSVSRGFAPGAMSSSWTYLGSASANPMGVEWFGMVMGLGFVLSFGYWCTDFLVIQRAMAAQSMNAARRTPIVAAMPKMVFPFLVILPGMVAISLLPAQAFIFNGHTDYNMALPLMLQRFYPAGLLGLGLTALLASFMSGMAGNVTAFNTVWTYDIYQAYINRRASDAHYLWMGRMATVFGTALSIATAYVAKMFGNIMDLLQLVFSFINAPLFATFLLGMFWARATPNGAFYGLIAGTLGAAVHYGLTGVGAGSTALHVYPSDMAQNFWGAIFAWTSCFLLTVAIIFSVFLVIFRYFRVPADYQHKVLFWGILGALVMRGMFIAVGSILISRFAWVMYIFGGFLIFTGIRMAFEHDEEFDAEKNIVMRTARRFLRRPELGMTEIAGRCGFGEIKNFYVAFRKVTGGSGFSVALPLLTTKRAFSTGSPSARFRSCSNRPPP